MHLADTPLPSVCVPTAVAHMATAAAALLQDESVVDRLWGPILPYV